MARVVVAPASFKGFASAHEAALAMAEGVRRAGHEAILCPLADGGEGTLEALAHTPGARLVWGRAVGPLGRPRRARLLLWSRRREAFVELAEAAGWARVRRSPATIWDRTTQGVGMLIERALRLGVRHLTVGLGGSATNDGGAGLLAALGAEFLDAEGRRLPPTPRHFARLAELRLAPCRQRLRGVRLDYLADVDNPLLGEDGATWVFARQKGARASDLPRLEAAMRRYAECLAAATGRDLAAAPYGGAAGGTGAALLALGATPRPGAETVAALVRLPQRLRHADLLLTGEGRLDRQTLRGKAPYVAARKAKEAGVPVAILVGQEGPNLLADLGAHLFVVTPGEMTRSEIRHRLPELLAARAAEAVDQLLGVVPRA